MKKILFSFMMLFIVSAGYSQPRGYPVRDSLLVNDTTYFLQFYDDGIIGIEFNYTGLGANDATIDIGYSNYGNTFNRVSSDFPFTLNITANKVSVNGTDKASLFVLKDNWPGKYLVVKLTEGSVSNKYIYYSFIK